MKLGSEDLAALIAHVASRSANVRADSPAPSSGSAQADVSSGVPLSRASFDLCANFVNGNCTRGDRCFSLHGQTEAEFGRALAARAAFVDARRNGGKGTGKGRDRGSAPPPLSAAVALPAPEAVARSSLAVP